MASLREIAASDDEESDFDHIDDPIDDPIDDAIDDIQDVPAPAPVQDNEAQEGNHSHHDGSNVSTDLSFFQRVYDEQRAVIIAGTYIGTNITTQGLQPPTHKSDQSSSITDPVPASRRPLKRKIGENVIDLTELTQVTTPRKSGDGKGKTGEGESGALQIGKRTQANTKTSPEEKEEISQPSIVRIDPYDFPDDEDDDYTVPSIPKKTKTTKRAPQASTNSLPVAQPDATPDHDDISFIPLPPSEHAPSSVVQLRSYQKPISSEENASTSSLSTNATATQRLYIAPSTLTASQKEEYRIVSLSTQGTQEILATQDNLATQENISPGSSLPAVPPSDPYPPQMLGDGLLYAGAGTVYKSSGMTTIVPSNLSEMLRDRAGNPLDAAAAAVMTLTSGLGLGSLEMGTPARVRTAFPASSPDIIGGGSPGIRTSGEKRKATQVLGEDVTESLGSSRLAEIREMSAEDNADHVPDATDNHPSTILGNDKSLNEQTAEKPVEPATLSNTVPKKRGRKKKERVQTVTEDTILDNSFEATEDQQPEEVLEPTEPEQPPPKRRRGRSRKSDVAATQKAPKQPTPAPEPDEGDELASPAPTTGRRRRGTDNTNTRTRKASAPIVIDDSESDGNLSDPPEEISEPEKEVEEGEPEIPPSDQDDEEEEEEEPPRKRGRPAAAAAPPPPLPPTKGKRGRPPKNKVVQEVSASTAKKNGRSKSKVQVEDSEDDDQDHDLKKDLEEDDGNVESNKDTREEEITPVPGAKPAPSPEPPTTKEKDEDNDKDKDTKKEKEIIKPTSFLSTQGKVKYRVGLSKRSRVASLLKVVPRKQ